MCTLPWLWLRSSLYDRQRVFCDCSAGDSRIEQVRAALEEEGLDPDDPDYQWTRRSDVIREEVGHLSN